MEIITGKYTIKQIFKDKNLKTNKTHWDEYLEKHSNTPDYIKDEVRKMMNCRDPKKNGFSKYACPNHPNECIIIPHSCKSRLCNSCGVSQTDKWVNNTIGDFPNTSYFHIVFTIPDYLWYFFHHQSNRILLDFLFKASSETVLGWYKQRGITPSITSVLHTFGKKLNFNTHIHMIVSAAGLSKDKLSWKKINYLPWNVFKKRWKTILLKMLSKYIDSSFKKMLFKINWYVHLGIRLINPIFTCKYIGRYTKRPVIAESRISDYDGNFVTFFYEDKSEGCAKKEYCRFTCEEFIANLIQHIPLKQFKMIRYYGTLAVSVRKKCQKIIFKLLNQSKKIFHWLRWRAKQIKFKKIDPLICPICNQEMILKEFAFYSSLTKGLCIKIF